MRIGGFHPFSLSAYPGKVAAIVFCQGCNFCCPWCHNRQLISPSSPQSRLIPAETVLARLRHLHGRLDGVVVTGGEPTIQDDLPNFLGQLIALGLAVKLDTNGSLNGLPDIALAMAGLQAVKEFIESQPGV